MADSSVTTLGPVHKSPNDTREYRYIVLPNGMKALLVHDAEADKAAAALDVNIGAHILDICCSLQDRVVQ